MGQRPTPTAIRRAKGNPGKRAWNHAEPIPRDAQPRCPEHLSAPAKREWRRVAGELHRMGVLTTVDRAALAAYCQAWGRWVEAEEKLRETPALFKTPGGYVQQSPWLGIAHKQLEIMGRYMVELGMTPAARSRVSAADRLAEAHPQSISLQIVRADATQKLTAYLDDLAARQKAIEGVASELAPAPGPGPEPDAPAAGSAGEIIS